MGLGQFKVRGGFHFKSPRPKADSSLPTPDHVFALVKTQVPGILLLIGTMVRRGTTLSSLTAIKQEHGAVKSRSAGSTGGSHGHHGGSGSCLHSVYSQSQLQGSDWPWVFAWVPLE